MDYDVVSQGLTNSSLLETKCTAVSPHLYRLSWQSGTPKVPDMPNIQQSPIASIKLSFRSVRLRGHNPARCHLSDILKIHGPDSAMSLSIVLRSYLGDVEIPMTSNIHG